MAIRQIKFVSDGSEYGGNYIDVATGQPVVPTAIEQLTSTAFNQSGESSFADFAPGFVSSVGRNVGVGGSADQIASQLTASGWQPKNIGGGDFLSNLGDMGMLALIGAMGAAPLWAGAAGAGAAAAAESSPAWLSGGMNGSVMAPQLGGAPSLGMGADLGAGIGTEMLTTGAAAVPWNAGIGASSGLGPLAVGGDAATAFSLNTAANPSNLWSGSASGSLGTPTGVGQSGMGLTELTNTAAGLPAGGVPATGVSAIDFPGQVLNLSGGGMTAPASFLDNVMSTVAKYGSNAIGAVQRLIQGGGTEADLMKLLGAIAPAALGMYASNKQADSYRELADKFLGYGAPSRARFEASFQPGFTMANEPGYQDALDQTTKSFLHKASVAGNPADSPNAWNQTLKDVNATFAYPALQDYRRVNAGAGGLATLAPAGANAASSAIGADANVWNAAGAGAANIFNPPKSAATTLAELMKEMKGV